MSHYSRPFRTDIELVNYITPKQRAEIHAKDCSHSRKAINAISEFIHDNAKEYEDYYHVAPCAKGEKGGYFCDKGECMTCM